MVEYFNPNPSGKSVGDCAIRAVCKALDLDWGASYIALCVQGYAMNDLPNADVVWCSLLKSRGFEKGIVPNSCPDCYTVGDFARDNTNGIYVLGTGRHAVCVKYGTIYDSWDSSSEIPLFYMKEVNHGI